MAAVGARKDPVKTRAAWAAEKVGRLKLNGRVRGYSDLSRVLELEGLRLGVEGKRSLWKSLDELDDPRLAATNFADLRERAASQLDELEIHRLAAVRTALAS